MWKMLFVSKIETQAKTKALDMSDSTGPFMLHKLTKAAIQVSFAFLYAFSQNISLVVRLHNLYFSQEYYLHSPLKQRVVSHFQIYFFFKLTS